MPKGNCERVRIEFKTGNAAFEESPTAEIARILRKIADDISGGFNIEGGPCRDINGNTVGAWSIEAEE